MHNTEHIAQRDFLLCEVMEKYGEWLEMSSEPECMLIEILGSLLLKSQEDNKYLKKIAYNKNHLLRTKS